MIDISFAAWLRTLSNGFDFNQRELLLAAFGMSLQYAHRGFRAVVAAEDAPALPLAVAEREGAPDVGAGLEHRQLGVEVGRLPRLADLRRLPAELGHPDRARVAVGA